MSRLRDALEAGEFVVTGEVAPPLGTDLSHMMEAVDALGPNCTALNVTDNQGATLHLSSLARIDGGARRRVRADLPADVP